MTDYPTLDDLDVAGKRVLLRVDFNVPIKDGKVTDATRIERAVPTISELLDKGARVIVLSHMGRPKGKADPSLSLRLLVEPLRSALGGRDVAFAPDCVGPQAEAVVAGLGSGQVALLENLRFHAGEEANDPEFAGRLAALGDIYVNDAFSAAHRAHASVEAIVRRRPSAAGRLMQAELDALTRALEKPERPVAAVVGGAKISTKLELLRNLVRKVDSLVLGGAMANTFLEAQGRAIGTSLSEHDMLETAREIASAAEEAGCALVLPVDAVVARAFEAGADATVVPVDAVPSDVMILDIGPASVADLSARFERCRTVLWNGPLGAFEVPPFDAGTTAVARVVARLTRDGHLISVAGGGDTVAALAKAGVIDDLSYVSAAGGAFLEWLEGKDLPGVAALRENKRKGV